MTSLVMAAAAFTQHVELDEGVLATSAPLETAALDRIVGLTADALRPVAVDLAQRVGEVRERLMTQRYCTIDNDIPWKTMTYGCVCMHWTVSLEPRKRWRVCWSCSRSINQPKSSSKPALYKVSDDYYQ